MAKKSLWVLALGIVGALYLLNIGFGIVEIIPDNTPLLGNIDEAVAAVLVVRTLAQYGIKIA